MASTALVEWQGRRAARIDELMEAHKYVGGEGAGRRWRTEQINWALILRLAAEFQGFARDLHDEGAVFFADRQYFGNQAIHDTLYALLTRGRRLDRANADPGVLGEDFGRFGLEWWPALHARDSRTDRRQAHLDHLMTARNGIAHDDQGKA